MYTTTTSQVAPREQKENPHLTATFMSPSVQAETTSSTPYRPSTRTKGKLDSHSCMQSMYERRAQLKLKQKRRPDAAPTGHGISHIKDRLTDHLPLANALRARSKKRQCSMILQHGRSRLFHSMCHAHASQIKAGSLSRKAAVVRSLCTRLAKQSPKVATPANTLSCTEPGQHNHPSAHLLSQNIAHLLSQNRNTSLPQSAQKS